MQNEPAILILQELHQASADAIAILRDLVSDIYVSNNHVMVLGTTTAANRVDLGLSGLFFVKKLRVNSEFLKSCKSHGFLSVFEFAHNISLASLSLGAMHQSINGHFKLDRSKQLQLFGAAW